MAERVPVPPEEGGLRKKRASEPAPLPPDDAGTEAPAPCNCPHLDANDWDEVESDWSDIAFARDSIAAVLGVPVGFAGIRDGLRKKAEAAGGTVPEDAMLLVGSGRFRRDVLLEVEGVERGKKGVVFPGGFALSRLRSVPWGEMQREVEAAKLAARLRYGRDPDDLYVWYLTCRQCSQERDFETLIVAHYKEST